MSVVQPVCIGEVQTVWHEDFSAYTKYPTGTYVDDMTADFTRHWPATSSDRLVLNLITDRLQLNGSGGSDFFSWDVPGETSGSFLWKFLTHDQTSGFTTEMLFCWTPNGSKTDRGTCYSIFVQDLFQSIRYFEDGVLDTTLDTASDDIQSTSSYWTEVEFGGSGNDVDVYIYRSDGSKPGTPTMSFSSPALTSGKIGFYCYGYNGEGFYEFYIDKGWSP